MRNVVLSLRDKALWGTKRVVRDQTLPIQRVDMLHAPDSPEVLRMILELGQIYRKQRQLAAILSVPVKTLRRWLQGRHYPPAGSLRSIWVIHCLHFAPWKLRTSFDLITWGRYARRPKGESPPQHGG